MENAVKVTAVIVADIFHDPVNRQLGIGQKICRLLKLLLLEQLFEIMPGIFFQETAYLIVRSFSLAETSAREPDL